MTGICTTPQRPRLGRDSVTGRLLVPRTRNGLILTHVAPSWAKLNLGGRGSTILTVRMFMSDDNYRKPSSPRATRIGLGLTGTDASYGANSGLAEVESDTRYMEPPSETHGVEREEMVRRLRDDTEASAARAATGNHGLFGSTLRAHTVQRAPLSANDDMQPQADEGDPGLFQVALDNTVRAQPVAAPPISTRPPPPAAPSRAPEAWRDEVRRMVERAPSKGPTSSPTGTPSQSPGGLGGYGGPNTPGGSSLPPAPAHKPSLRLKLDADAAEESAYRAPKSALPKVMMWLVILGMLGGGFWLYAESRGGVAALIQEAQGGQPTLTAPAAEPATAPTAPVAADPGVAPQQPSAAAAPAAVPTQAPAQQPAATAQPSAAPVQRPSPAPTTRPAAPSGTAAANSTAAPSTPKAQPSATAPTPAAEAPEKNAEPAPAASPKAAALKAPPRQVRPQQPVVKVRPIESAPSASEPAAAPGAAEPLDIPYVPLPGDPPAPDDAR